MQARTFEITGPLELLPRKFGDERGYFVETFNLKTAISLGVAETPWVQDNQSFSALPYTLRGMHFQLQPMAQAKIVRVLNGSIFDAVVDLRPESSHFGKWLSVVLRADQMNQLYVPEGFAHGFLTLEPDVQVAYKVSNFYSTAHDRSLNWADAEVGIDWPLPSGVKPILSDKDRSAPDLKKLKSDL